MDNSDPAYGTRCFLCLRPFSDRLPATVENVMPKWLVRRKVRYTQRIVPCCTEFNQFMSAKLESRVSAAFRAGFDAVRALQRQPCCCGWPGCSTAPTGVSSPSASMSPTRTADVEHAGDPRKIAKVDHGPVRLMEPTATRPLLNGLASLPWLAEPYCPTRESKLSTSVSLPLSDTESRPTTPGREPR